MKEIMTFNGFLRWLQPWMFDLKPRFRSRLFGSVLKKMLSYLQAESRSVHDHKINSCFLFYTYCFNLLL